MKHKLSALLTCLFFIFCLIPDGISASADTDASARARQMADRILQYRLDAGGYADVQSWIDNGLTESAGTSAEFNIIALQQYGAYDFSIYADALETYLSEHTVTSASTQQKYALALAVCGRESTRISEAISCAGEQGIMSFVFALHLLNNGYSCEAFSTEDIIRSVLDSRCDDGGWAVMGQTADVDVTAMTLQSLAPHYHSTAEIKAAVDDALTLLSERQLEDGDFSSYGQPNAESTAQVICALTALDIDCATDARFIKNGNNPLDGLEKYQQSDGSFSHLAAEKSSETATTQAFLSLVSYLEGGSPYLLPKVDEQRETTAPAVSATTTAATTTTAVTADTDAHDAPGSYKPAAIAVSVLLGAIVCILLTATGKRHRKNYITVGILTLLVIVFISVTDFKSRDSYYSGIAPTKENPIGTVTITIRCDCVAGKTDSDYIPEDGVILAVTEFEICENDTVSDILTEAAQVHNIHLEFNGPSYVAGIQYLYEFDFGDLSGWIYRVNGETPSVGCNDYRLSDGDAIEWIYTCHS